MTFLRIGETQIKIRNAERLDTVRCRAFLFDLGGDQCERNNSHLRLGSRP